MSDDEGAFTEEDMYSPTRDAAISTLAMAMLFGSIIFATASLAARLWLAGMWSWENRGEPMHVTLPSSSSAKEETAALVSHIDSNSKELKMSMSKQPLDTSSLPSIYNLLYHSSVFGLILLYSYICEHHPPYPHDEKTYDRDEFLFLTILVVVIAGGHSLKKNVDIRDNAIKQTSRSAAKQGLQDNRGSIENSENAILNRYQTEEWKGWMQFIFLLYHYMHAVEVYNSIRVMITCYVWMTGFGNFMFFHKTKDYSLHRILQMLWRLNFLVLFLCLTQGNPYILYYICPLHTYYFLMVLGVMYIGKEKNDTKWWMRTKLGVLAIIIYIVWDCESYFGIFNLLHHFFLSDESVEGARAGTMWEWYFRSNLDHWSVLLGMIFAINYPITMLWFRKIEARSTRRQWMGKMAVAFGMLYALLAWVKGPLTYPKIQYNETNPYFGFIPLVAYIFLRNLTPTMRSYSMDLLHEIGKTTLETYLMQHHIWLSSNSKTVLTFIPGWPRVNLVMVTFIYVLLSRKIHNLTLLLRTVILPDDREACIRSLVGLMVAIAGFYCTAFVVEEMGMSNLMSVGVVSIVCGTLLYQSVMDSTWATYREAAKAAKKSLDADLGDSDDHNTTTSESEFSTGNAEDQETTISRFCPPLIGAMVVLVIGLIWNGFAATGASSIGRLPPTCDAFVNNGSWIPIDGCNEASRSMAYRENHVSSFGMCLPHGNANIWAWDKQPSHTHCRFGNRDEMQVKKVLNNRKVVFIGDSMTRNLYHASLRMMGITGSGAYDATLPKHQGITNLLWGKTPVLFKWAPLAVDQFSILKEVNDNFGEGNRAPDLIVLGGGAWDRLHVYATDEDRQSHAATLKDLSAEMLRAQQQNAAVVWFIPTTINSLALNTEEKRDHMREEDMEAMRAVYAKNGVLSASSFVLDGPTFTASRVSESFDGVHYPPQIYDAGAQILANALDWLIPPNQEEPVIPPQIGKMSNPMLGFMMLVLVGIGLFTFDGFLGFTYLASAFVKGLKPHELFRQALRSKKSGHEEVSDPDANSNSLLRSRLEKAKARKRPPKAKTSGNLDSEIAALIGR
ncbi:hypothetical protein ACHAWT_004974 [Skeletonema menzelii]